MARVNAPNLAGRRRPSVPEETTRCLQSRRW
jgi:hypothetical protein